MQTLITLTQEEIIEAIRRFVEAEGVTLDGMEAEISINAVRSPTGFNATVQLEKAGTKKKAARRPARVVPAKVASEEETTTEVVPEIQETEDTAVAVPEVREELVENDLRDPKDEVVEKSPSIFDVPAVEEAPKAAPKSSSSLFD
jgi:hypothetical protein